MLHVLYIIINISLLSYEENQRSGNVMHAITGPYIYGVNRRSENFLLLSDLLFA